MAVTPLEDSPAEWLSPGLPAIRTEAQSPDVEHRLQERRRWLRSLRHALAASDLLACTAVAGAALTLGRPIAGVMVLVVALAVVATGFTADRARAMVAVRPMLKAALSCTVVACAVLALAGSSTGREVALGSAAATTVLLLVRLAVRLPGPARRYDLDRRRGLLVGDHASLERAASRGPGRTGGREDVPVVTRADRSEPAPSPELEQRRGVSDGSRPTGLVERVVRTALDAGAERVTVLPGPSWGQQQLRELSWLLEGTGIDMVIATELDGIAPHRVDVESEDARLMIKVGSASPRGLSALVKATLDRVLALALLVLSAPLLALLAVAIRAESPGPAIFRQTRVREGGATFTMYKFRTMRVDAEQQLGALQALSMHGADKPLFKMADDPRVTRVGQVLRRTSLDELPQLVNVLQGQMSLIGPRPALPVEVEMYDFVARRRLAVKPGMTGLWQVSGRSRLSWDESIGIDLDYVDNWSPAADASIALRTFRAVMTKDGAF